MLDDAVYHIHLPAALLSVELVEMTATPTNTTADPTATLGVSATVTQETTSVPTTKPLPTPGHPQIAPKFDESKSSSCIRRSEWDEREDGITELIWETEFNELGMIRRAAIDEDADGYWDQTEWREYAEGALVRVGYDRDGDDEEDAARIFELDEFRRPVIEYQREHISDTFEYRAEYKYDDRNGMIVQLIDHDGDGDWERSATYRYTDNQLRSYRLMELDSGTEVSAINYVWRGEFIIERVTLAGSTVAERSIIEMRDGMIVEIQNDQLGDGTIETRLAFMYDDVGRLIGTESYEGGAWYSTQTYTYDLFGRIEIERQLSIFGSLRKLYSHLCAS